MRNMQKAKLFFVLIALLFWNSACQNDKQIPTSLKNILPNKYFTILISYSSDCPLCQRYTQKIRTINDSLPSNFQLYFIKVHADEKWDFDWSQPLEKQTIQDPQSQICRKLGIKVYPQVVILSKMGKIHYSGAIDNSATEIGTISVRITKDYLKQAIVQLSADNQKVMPSNTAIGCFVE